MITNLFLDGETVPAQGGSLWTLLIMILVFAAAMYFLVYRPQKKQEKEQTNMRNSLGVGDEVTTIGGIIGRVVSIKDETFVLETTKERTKIRFLRSSIKSIDVKAADATGVLKEDKKPAEQKPAEKKPEPKPEEPKPEELPQTEETK
ncbi:MAG: preprotein translocase subunit YajC [Clostridiales bacterium]|nr:preprotein translocase subunit YajC [Clostridiales bacterium]